MMNAQWLFTPKKSWQVEKLKYAFSYFSSLTYVTEVVQKVICIDIKKSMDKAREH